MFLAILSLATLIDAFPFKSQSQWGWAFANRKPFARRWARETKGPSKGKMKRLPKRVKRKKK